MKLKNLKLAQLSKAELSQRELNRLIGGEKCCICSCRTNPSVSNHVSNTAQGYESVGGYGGTGGGAFGPSR